MRCLLCDEFSHRIQWAEIQFTIEDVVVLCLRDDLLTSDLAALVVPARHVNVGSASSQIQYGLATDSGIAAGHNHYFAVDANVAVVLPTLNPFSAL